MIKESKIIDFYRYWSRTSRNRNWAKINIKLMKISDFLKLDNIIHVGFLYFINYNKEKN